jgi:hypothetical protein
MVERDGWNRWSFIKNLAEVETAAPPGALSGFRQLRADRIPNRLHLSPMITASGVDMIVSYDTRTGRGAFQMPS